MKPDNLRKRERLFKHKIEIAEDREKKGFFEGAALAYLEASKLLPRDKYPQENINCLNIAGCIYIDIGKHDLAETPLQEALSILIGNKKISKEYFINKARILGNLGIIYFVKENLSEAEKYAQESIDILENAIGKDHSEILSSLNNLANVYIKKGHLDNAVVFLSRALIIALENKDLHFTKTLLNNLGVIYASKGDINSAENCYNFALSIAEKLGVNDTETIKVLNNFGSLYANKNELEKAKDFFQQAKDITEKYPLTIDCQTTNTVTKGYQKILEKIDRLECEKLEIQAALYQSKKLEYLGQMATMMAHNMNQPIGVIRMATSGALGDINENLFNPETELKPLLEKILNQTERLSLIMSNFRSFSRGDRTVLSAVNLNNIIEDIYQLLFVAQYQLDKIDFQKELVESPIAHANEFAIQEMLISLLSNAREAVKDKPIKQIKIITWQQDNQVGFCVEDNGDGIKEDDLPKLFTPFLSSKNEGMGLGLYFCREIARDLGGSIEYYSASLGGAGFKIILPVQQDNENGAPI